MKSVDFPQVNARIAENQPEYETLHAHVDFESSTTPVTFCMELSDEEIEELVKTKQLWYTQLTFGQTFQPIMMYTGNPFVQKEG